MNFTLKYGNTQSYQFNMKKETVSRIIVSRPQHVQLFLRKL